MEDVVEVESPVHRDEVVVRIRSAWNLLRSGGRIQTALDTAIQKAINEGLIIGGDFLCIKGKESIPRDRSLVNSPGLRRIEMLPPVEIDAGILSVIEVSMGETAEQIIQAVSRMLGFKSTSSQLRDLINGRKHSLVVNGRLTESDGMFRVLHQALAHFLQIYEKIEKYSHLAIHTPLTLGSFGENAHSAALKSLGSSLPQTSPRKAPSQQR